ncbi:LexA family protein [Candidatus Dactylopiibacterium carminicum]|nr:S24 family peptidase [Candidatus Dactylopiibacterium carminicum]
MDVQLALPFVSLVGASPLTPPEACAEVKRPRRATRQALPPPLASSGQETPPQAGPDDEARRLDVHDYLVRNDAATFFFQVRGDAMAAAEIFDGDILVVDKGLQPQHGHLVLAYVNGERLVRRLHHRGRKTALQTDNPEDAELVPEDGSELVIWGVVTGKFRRFQT